MTARRAVLVASACNLDGFIAGIGAVITGRRACDVTNACEGVKAS
jgi:hypothetical protein